MAIFKKLLQGFVPKWPPDSRESQQDIPNLGRGYKETNHVNELQLLTGHSDIVRLLCKVQDKRVASASDDGSILIWDTDDGILLKRLEGHTRAVMCMLLLEDNLLVSGSADRSVRMWDLNTGECIKKIENCHEGSVKCLTRIDEDRFCSGGNDRYLFIWNRDGSVYGRIERQEEENLHCLLTLPNDRIVTGSNSSLLLVYSTKGDLGFQKILAYHRESVRCLVLMNDDHFVSASLDGAIVVWQTDTLKPLKKLNYPEQFRSMTDHGRQYIYNVNHLLKLSDTYVAACIGTGFRVYDVFSGECILSKPKAHSANVLQIISLYHGTRLVTCSVDSNIRLWGTTENYNFSRPALQGFSGGSQNRYRLTNRRASAPRIQPVCMGEMYVHSDSVNTLLPLSEYGFASASNDRLVILWKDGRIEMHNRSQYAAKSLKNYNELFKRLEEELEDHDGEQTPRPAYASTPSPLDQVSSFLQDASSPPLLSSEPMEPVEPQVPITTAEPENKDKTVVRKVHIPVYIFQHAEHLRKEKNLPIDDISNYLKARGHSDTIVKAVADKQRTVDKLDKEGDL